MHRALYPGDWVYQSIGQTFGLYVTATGQVSSDPLLATEEFTLGGAQFGRAFDYSEMSGDDGAAAAIEFRHGRNPGWRSVDFYQLYAFYDIGSVWNQGDIAVIDHASLSSAGFGLRLTMATNTRLNLEAARPLTGWPAEVRDGDWRGFVSLSSSF